MTAEQMSVAQTIVMWVSLVWGALLLLVAVSAKENVVFGWMFTAVVLVPGIVLLVKQEVAKAARLEPERYWERPEVVIRHEVVHTVPAQPVVVNEVVRVSAPPTLPMLPAAKVERPEKRPGYDPRKAYQLNDCCANCVDRSVCYASQLELNEGVQGKPEMYWGYHCPNYARDTTLAPGKVVNVGPGKK